MNRATGWIAACLVALALLPGCERPMTWEEKVAAAERATVEKVKKGDHLPDGAANIKHEGGSWVSFDLERGGVKHRYLYRFWYGSHSEVGHTLTRMD